jgi:intracellular sulfur oxidation DsrE/DsrF family protein
MKKLVYAGLVLLMCVGGAFAKDAKPKINWEYPEIKDNGGILYHPDVAIQPSKTLDYKVFFKITSGKKKPNGVNAQLWHVARLLNLLKAAGVPQDHIHVAAGIAGKATEIVMTDASYAKRFKKAKANPNTKLIKDLTDAGVKIYLCSQAAAEHNIDMKTQLNPNIIKSLSLLTDIVNFQLEGYALVP